MPRQESELPREESDLPPPPPVTWFPINASKGTKELFSSSHAIFCCFLHMNITLKAQEMDILEFKISRESMPSRPPKQMRVQLSSGSSLVKVNLKSLKQPSFGLLANLEVQIFSYFYKKYLVCPPPRRNSLKKALHHSVMSACYCYSPISGAGITFIIAWINGKNSHSCGL